jgi:hypothetical protein
MKARLPVAALVSLLGLTAISAPAAAAEIAARACDGACLRGALDRYLDALVKRDPGKLDAAPGLRFTENGRAGKPGDGLWQKASSLGTYRVYLTDAVSQQAMFIGVVNDGDAAQRPGHPRESGEPYAILALRLGIVNGKLAEAEQVVARKGSHALFEPASFTTPHAAFTTVVDPAKRATRDQLVTIADSYFKGIEQHDSKIILAADTCQRIENGVQTTGIPGRGSRNCAHSADLLSYINAVNDRRYPIVDPEHGIVVSTIMFDIPGEATAPSATPAETRARQPRTLLLTEVFRIDDGKIQHIEAVMHNLPHGSKSGWEK